MTKFSKKSSSTSLNSNLCIQGVTKPYNPLDHFQVCMDIVKYQNLPIPDTHKTFHEAYKRYISFERYPYSERRFNIDTTQKPCLISCSDVNKYMSELVMPKIIDKLKFNYNWAMERWKFMYKKRIVIERFQSAVKRIIEKINCEKSLISIKCSPWIHFMPDPYKDSTIYSTRYCLKKMKDKNFTYFICGDEFCNEIKYSIFKINSFDNNLEDDEEEDIMLPSSFNNNFNYKEIKEKKSILKTSLDNKDYNSKKYNHNNTEFVYFVKKIIMERRRTNPSGDPWDAFFYIHMEPDKNDLIFKINKKEMSIEKKIDDTTMKNIEKEIIDNDESMIDSTYSDTSSISPNLESENNKFDVLNVKRGEISSCDKTDEKNEKASEKSNFEIDSNNDLFNKEDNNKIIHYEYSNESMGLSRHLNLLNKSSSNFINRNRRPSLVKEAISEKEINVYNKNIPIVNHVATRDRGTNTLPMINKKSETVPHKIKPIQNNKIFLPNISKKGTNSIPNWKVTSIVRHSPDGKTTSNRSFYLPRISHTNLAPPQVISFNMFNLHNSFPQIGMLSRPTSSSNKIFVPTPRQNHSPSSFL
uniref:MADF domain-containing protein n=1 Tax=Parastrongyloides trichosuri TaxID=131310 RepID=A0A0N4ZK51_PARTI